MTNDCHIDRLLLQNYRCFPELDISFDKKLTVIVARNGGGKTAVLDALAVALRLFVDTIEGRSTSKGFNSTDIRLVQSPQKLMEPVTPARLVAEGSILGHSISWARERQSQEASRTTTAEAQELKRIATLIGLLNKKYSQVKTNSGEDVKNAPVIPLYPLISYYGTGRLWSATKLTESKKTSASSALNARARGYTDCLSSSSHYKYFIDWFRRFSYEAVAQAKGSSPHEPQRVLDAVCRSVDIALEPSGWQNLSWDFAEDIITAAHAKYGQLPVDLLSDGIRNIVGLVADIAHRTARLNPQLGENAATRTPGIVLIDEVDMHLHPEWQQMILGALRSAFPLVQFIVTTHSPQVLSTVRKENVRTLVNDELGNWTATQPSASPLGHESGDALANIMGTHPRPNLPEVLSRVHAYEQLVRSGRGDSSDAKEILEDLEKAGFEFTDAEEVLFEFLLKKARKSETDKA